MREAEPLWVPLGLKLREDHHLSLLVTYCCPNYRLGGGGGVSVGEGVSNNTVEFVSWRQVLLLILLVTLLTHSCGSG